MRMYFLCRKEDVSGTSGVGHIAEVAEFGDGAAVVRWIGTMNMSGVTSTTVFNSIDDVRRIHGHEGRTDVELVLDAGRIKELEKTVEALQAELRQAKDLLARHGL